MAAILGEACAQAARAAVSPAATSRLELRFIAPVPIAEAVRIAAQLVAGDDRQATAEATVLDSTGMLLAHARAEIAGVRPEFFLSTPQGRARGLDWLAG